MTPGQLLTRNLKTMATAEHPTNKTIQSSNRPWKTESQDIFMSKTPHLIEQRSHEGVEVEFAIDGVERKSTILGPGTDHMGQSVDDHGVQLKGQNKEINHGIQLKEG